MKRSKKKRRKSTNRKNTKKKKRLIKKIIKLLELCLFIILLIIIGIIGFKIFSNKEKQLTISYKDMYLSSSNNTVPIYTLDEDDNLKEEDNLIRGTKVTNLKKSINKDNITYIKIKYKGNKYYVLDSSLVNDIKDIVLEKNKYVRTSSTIYANDIDTKIKSFVKKGSKIEIIGYDKVLEDGNVNMYNIKYNDIDGWMFSKYLVDTEAEAITNYNENNIYDIHKDRKYSKELYGGHAGDLDYYPVEKIEFEDNPLLKEAKTIYLNGTTISNIDSYIDLAKNSGINAMVVDIKDGYLAYPSEIAKDISPTSYNTALNDLDSYKDAISKIKKANIYVIGRIVVFNDSNYGKDHPEDCITSSVSNQLWPSAFSRNTWEYNVNLAIEAVKTMGFNEIQFDYVRFPEQAYNMSVNGNSDFKNKYNEEKAEAIQSFLYYATDQIHKEKAYVSVDVFGECSSDYVTAYGQYWPAISNIVDVISSMPYTDHFGRNTDTWSKPYQTIYNWGKEAAERQKEIPTPAVARTWITAYDTPFWNPTVTYDANKISDQIKALYDSNLNGGYITWNSSSSLNKYNQIKSAFNKSYN